VAARSTRPWVILLYHAFSLVGGDEDPAQRKRGAAAVGSSCSWEKSYRGCVPVAAAGKRCAEARGRATEDILLRLDGGRCGRVGKTGRYMNTIKSPAVAT
jgi:hypothetical protein